MRDPGTVEEIETRATRLIIKMVVGGVLMAIAVLRLVDAIADRPIDDDPLTRPPMERVE